MCVWVGGCMITSKAKKSTFLKFFLPSIEKTLILAFEANRALSGKNETKIVKLTHSDMGTSIIRLQLML